ncbi:MAG: SU10 major capsid protein [Alphaproteobacteria bacterium]
MALPTNTYTSYDNANSIKEDLRDVIYNITPFETPFRSKCGKSSAKATLHEWTTQALRSSAVNKHLEGDDTQADSLTAVTRLTNATQIFKNAVSIPGSDVGLSKAGKNREMGYQMLLQARAQNLDVEKALFANTAKNVGANATARELAGAPAWMTSNVDFQSGNSGANPTGDGTDARTDDGTPTAFSQTKFDSVMQSIWEAGGVPDTCYLSAFQMNAALSFTGNNNQRANVVAGDERVVNSISIYLTPWGQVGLQGSRENRSRDVFILQDDMWEIAELRPARNTPLGVTGDSERRQLIQELTLVCKNEASSGIIADNTTS